MDEKRKRKGGMKMSGKVKMRISRNRLRRIDKVKKLKRRALEIAKALEEEVRNLE